MRSPTTHASFHESLRYACKTRTIARACIFESIRWPSSPATETRYIRFAGDYICNRDGVSFRGALITGLDPPRLLAFPSSLPPLPSLLPFAPFFLQCSPCRSAHHFSPWFPLVFAKQNTRWQWQFPRVDAIRDSFSNENFLPYIFSLDAISLMNFVPPMKIIKVISIIIIIILIIISFFFGI